VSIMPPDRRTIRTQQALCTAMLALARTTPLEAITVEQIAERAGVARKTFYAHFASKEELLWASLETVYGELVAHLGELDPDTLLVDGRPLSYHVFRHVQEYAVLFRSLLGPHGHLPTLLRLWDLLTRVSYAKHAPLREQAPHITVEPALIASMVTGALLGALRWWLAHGLEPGPEAMAYAFSQIMAPGALGALGLEA
jgi:AcrR family transcriptional regulator